MSSQICKNKYIKQNSANQPAFRPHKQIEYE